MSFYLRESYSLVIFEISSPVSRHCRSEAFTVKGFNTLSDCRIFILFSICNNNNEIEILTIQIPIFSKSSASGNTSLHALGNATHRAC